ncbi:MAG: hypothetical protein AAFV72_10775 [Cyanobacteria bacterium J06635_1]
MKPTSTKIQITGFFAGLMASGLLLTSVAAQEELKRALNPPELANSLQYGYSQATLSAANAQLVHVAGQVGLLTMAQMILKVRLTALLTHCSPR